MVTENIKVTKLKLNPNNPRVIKDDKYKKLLKSIKDFPKMLQLRPIVVNDDMIVLGGNQRLKACKEAGYKEVPTIKASELTADEQREFIIKDNIGFGENDWDMLANEWDTVQLEEWGMDVEIKTSIDDEPYTATVETPVYEPKEESSIEEMYNNKKYKDLVSKIDYSSLPDNEKDFLKVAASRHIVFNYENVANYYAAATKEMQELMEESALVIIDYDKAIEQGYVQINEQGKEQYKDEYE